MAQTLEHNKVVTSVTAAVIPIFDEDMDIIQRLDDEPNDVGGLSAAQLKAEFDSAGNKTKEYINNELVPTIIASELTEESRVNAEAERVSNEIERVSNEGARKAAETARAEAETTRKTAESGRASAEDSRKTAEQAREAAEKARADETAGIVTQATQQANAAAQSAQASANSASDASASKNAAAASESNAASSASAASSSASGAASSKSAADSSAKLAQSWAEGGTGARSGEDTNNAKYWADQAKNAAKGDMMASTYDTKGRAQDIFDYVDQNAPRRYRHVFSAGDWSSAGTITLAAATHGITGSDIMCQASILVDGAYVRGTWATLETYAVIDETTHEITLYCGGEGYDGAAVMMG